MGEVPYSCVWTARGELDPATGDVQWFKPERVTSGRRDAFQLTSATADSVGIAIAWQEDPKGLMPGEGGRPWRGLERRQHPQQGGRLVQLHQAQRPRPDRPELPSGPRRRRPRRRRPRAGGPGQGPGADVAAGEDQRQRHLQPREHGSRRGPWRARLRRGRPGHPPLLRDPRGDRHRASPGSNRLCAYTVERTNPVGELHHVCVTADGRLLDGNTGASRPNLNLLPFKRQVECLGSRRLRGEQGRRRAPGGGRSRVRRRGLGRGDGAGGGPRRPLQARHGQEHHLPQLQDVRARDGGRRRDRQPAGDRRGRQYVST